MLNNSSTLAAFLTLAAIGVHAQEINKSCETGFLGRQEVTLSCLVNPTDLAFDPAGNLWIKDESRLLRYRGATITPDTPAELVVAALGNRIAIDPSGSLWVVTNSELFRVATPVSAASRPQLVYPAPYIVNAPATIRDLLFDAAGNLWLALADRILRFAPPFSVTMAPNLVLGQPSIIETRQIEPRQNRLTDVVAMRFDRTGALFVSDNAASRILVFRPPFATFMDAAVVIGQRDFNSFRPLPFEDGGIAHTTAMAFDALGALWIKHNESFVSVYRPPFRTGMSRDYWFDTIQPRPDTPPFPYRFSAGYQRLVFAPDNTLWFAEGPGWAGWLARLEPPIFSAGAVLNAAGFTPTPLAPGLLVTVFGVQLGAVNGASAQLESGKLPLSLGRTQVKVNGEAVPLLFVSERQLTFLVPNGLPLDGDAQLQVVNNGFHGPPVTVPVEANRPGLFTLPSGAAAVLNHENTLGPLQRGRFGIAFAAGLGPVTPEIPTGAPGGFDPLSTVTRPASVFINGVLCPTLFVGLAPGFPGLYQVNFEIPGTLPAAAAYRILLRQAGANSNEASIPLL